MERVRPAQIKNSHAISSAAAKNDGTVSVLIEAPAVEKSALECISVNDRPVCRLMDGEDQCTVCCVCMFMCLQMKY